MKKENNKTSNEQNNVWSKAAIELIITELRKRKTLYDHQHPDYLNRTKRQICLEGMCKVLFDKLGQKVSVEALKNKIQIIRSQFNKDLRLMARNKKYKPKFWCFKKMEWLRPYCNRYSSVPFSGSSTNPQSRTSANAIERGPAGTSAMTNEAMPHKSDIHQHEPQNLDVNQMHIQSDMTSTTTFDDEAAMSSSNILTSKLVETVLEDPSNSHGHNNMDYEDEINEQFYETIALTHQIVQNRIAAKESRAENGRSRNQNSSWEGELVKSQLDLIMDETIRSDTMWEIQCVLRRGIEQDRVLPKKRRNVDRKPSIANSEASLNGSYISLDSNDSVNEVSEMHKGA